MLQTNLTRAAWIAAMFAVGVTALMPVPQMPELPGHADKLVHLGCYSVLGLLAVLAQRGMPGRAAAALAMIGFGIAIELIQGRLPWRSFEWADIAANIAGVVIGAGAAALLRRRRAVVRLRKAVRLGAR